MLSTHSALPPKLRRARMTWFPSSLFNSNLATKMCRFNKINKLFHQITKINHLLTALWFLSHCITTLPSTKASWSTLSNLNLPQSTTSNHSRLPPLNLSWSSFHSPTKWVLTSKTKLRSKPKRCQDSRPPLKLSKPSTSLDNPLSIELLLHQLNLRLWSELSHNRPSNKSSSKNPPSNRLQANSKSSWATWLAGKSNKLPSNQ